MLFSGIPRVRLLDAPTPLEPLNRLREYLKCGPLYVKRDDCMALGMGGNKVRSLEFWLGQALKDEVKTVVVAGQPPSNLCRLTAAAAAKTGLKCVVLHNDDEEAAQWTGNFFLNHLYGAEVRFLGKVSEEERAAEAEKLVKELNARGEKACFVNDAVTGALGYVNAALEMCRQAEEKNTDLNHVVLCGSAGPTEAGFIYGLGLFGRAFKIHLVTVEYPPSKILGIIGEIVHGLEQKLRLPLTVPLDDLVVCHDRYLGKGYAVPTPESLDTARLLGRLEGLVLETTYNAKVFAGAVDLLKRKIIPVDACTCVLHTGGTPAIFGQARLFQAKRPTAQGDAYQK